jgi:DNA-binding CsgD family transcriptional regulator
MLIGRHAECAALAAVLAAARDGSGGTQVIVGEPGIGKSALLQWVAERADPARVVVARGIESEADLPYAALRDLLTPFSDQLDRLPAAQAGVISGAIGLGPPSGVDRFAVGVATLALLTAAAESRPLLLVVDDLQWIDSASGGALAFAGRRLEALPVLILASERTTAGAQASRLVEADVLSLGPLSPADASSLLAEGIPPAVAARILDTARGNPLALVELPQFLTDGQLEGVELLLDPIPTGNGLERAFAAQLAPLSDAGRQAILLAAADSSGTTSIVLGALAALGLDERALREVEALGLVALDADRLEFRHPLVRSAAYQADGASQRRAAHAALADAETDADRAVWHAAAAALGPDRKLVEELSRAGERAVQRGAPGAGAAAFERAAAFAADRNVRGEQLLSAARALGELGSLVRSLELAREAAAALDDSVRHAHAVTHLAAAQMALGDVEPAAAAIVEEAERIAGVDPTFAAAMSMVALNLPLHRLQAAAALGLAERAWAFGAADRPRMLVEHAGLALSKVVVGDPEGRVALIRLARDLPSAGTNGAVHVSAVGWGLVWVEEYDEARKLLSWAADLHRSSGSLRHLGEALHVLAELDFRVGRWAQAYAHAYESIDLYTETGQRADVGFVRGTVSRLDAACGKDDECRAQSKAAFDSDDVSGLSIAGAYANAALGLLELGCGSPEGAIAHLEMVEQLARSGGLGEPWVVHWAPDLVEATSRAGARDRAHEVLKVFEAQARATDRCSALAAAARCRGILSEGSGYQREFESALALHEHVDAPFERARTELAYGERLRRAGRRTEARSKLQSALARFDRLGARPWAERARAELRASGQTVRTPEQRSQNDLTPQEAQVAAIVADGATNREAAAALLLSGKTIEFHLGNVYRKLGIRSRTELARRL